MKLTQAQIETLTKIANSIELSDEESLVLIYPEDEDFFYFYFSYYNEITEDSPSFELETKIIKLVNAEGFTHDDTMEHHGGYEISFV